MLEKRRLIGRRLFVLYSLHFIDDDRVTSTLNINFIDLYIVSFYTPNWELNVEFAIVRTELIKFPERN